MANNLIHRIAQKISVEYHRLSLVSNPDGLLLTDDVRYLLRQEEGLTIISGSPLQLRMHFELVYKTSVDERFVYVAGNRHTILPDIQNEAFCADLSVSDLFPMLDAWFVTNIHQFDVLSALYDKKLKRRVDSVEAGRLIGEIQMEIEQLNASTAAHFKESIGQVPIDWGKGYETVSKLSEVIVEASRSGRYDAIEDGVLIANEGFQQWVDTSYFASLNSNHLLAAKSVNKILPHIEANYGQEDRIALMVVDGLAYWQYLILEEYLRRESLEPVDNVSLAWMPTITMLSRQAIFRGENPKQDYKQSPENEKKLWMDYWQNHGFSAFEIQYQSDKDKFGVEDGVKRYAYVTMEMDKKMHSSTDMRDLFSLTDNWCNRFVGTIQAIKSKGYTIFLTSDHGGTLSYGWRNLSTIEKAFLYKDGSRGKRHLIFNNSEDKKVMMENFSGIRVLDNENWFSVRDNHCFDSSDQTMVTHGGSHFMEVFVPFVKI